MCRVPRKSQPLYNDNPVSAEPWVALPVWACHMWVCLVGVMRSSTSPPFGSSALAGSAPTGVLTAVTAATSAVLFLRTCPLFWSSPHETVRHLQGIPGIPPGGGKTDKGTACTSPGTTAYHEQPRPENGMRTGWSPLPGPEALGSLPSS